jgi:4-amino-4-deoxy-L-arabinose transferase-like glycosyltransferase
MTSPHVLTDDAGAPARATPRAGPRSVAAVALMPVGLFLLALAVRAVLAALNPDPGYPDSAYYVDIARTIAAGKGFSENFLWTFIDVGGRIPANPHLPVPSNAHWAPLASIVQVPFVWLLGPTQLASLLPFVLVGALAAPLGWAIARDAGSAPLVQVGAGILGAVPGLATVFTAQPDNFGLTMVLGGSALWLTSRGLRGHARSFVAAGLLVGLATLARTDGLLLAAAPAAAVAWDRWRAWRARPGSVTVRGLPGPPAIPLAAVVGCVLAFFVVVGPWWIRQLAVFGSLSPSTGAGILWLRSFAELNSVTAPRTLSAFLAQPLGDLVGSRVMGFAAAIGIYLTLVCAVFLAPFAAIGWWRRRRSVETGPWLVAAVVLLLVSGLLFAIHVPNGQFLHASVALAPHTYWLAMEGLMAVAGWASARRRSLEAGRLASVLTVGVLAVVIAGSALAADVVGSGWQSTLADRRLLADAIDRLAAPGDRLMSEDSSTFEYLTGHGGIVSPDDPLPVIEQAARAYDVRWLIVERNGAVRALTPLLDGAAPPDWLGPPALVLPESSSAAAGAAPVAAVIYPVCFDQAAPGCTPGGAALEAGP